MKCERHKFLQLINNLSSSFIVDRVEVLVNITVIDSDLKAYSHATTWKDNSTYGIGAIC